MIFRRIFLWPFALIYGGILSLRNACYDWGVFKLKKVDVPVISVGNLSVGGTGKTPHVKFLVEKLKSTNKVGILLRGYGRKSKGVLRVTVNCNTDTVGDEALLYKKKYQDDVSVVVAEKRIEGAQLLVKEKSKIDLIILDDAYQHRAIYRDVNILLTEFQRPFWKDSVLPAGNLREFTAGKQRADVIIVTKCPTDLSPEQKLLIRQKIQPKAHQLLCFSQIDYGNFIPFHNHGFGLPEKILLVTGIANAEPLVEHLSKIAEVKHLSFADHYDYKSRDIQQIHELFDTFAVTEKVIVTTEKDYMRLLSSGYFNTLKNYPWFYKEISVRIDEEEELLKRIKRI